ncbi:hypothetical protein ES319_A05G117600v1 [Gossypium barbadense]|uniref:Uncharacterized protein n=1 Tax=Gossypium barbadense TaxID=3634 RepID=A0A5J5VMZ6_GOSBA|nr:hypothetical protein ES319_A05G117600v1 [Gossypium barbadense]
MLRLPSHNQRLHLLLRNLSSFASKTTIFKTSKHFIPSHLLPQTLSPEHFSTPSKHSFPLFLPNPSPKTVLSGSGLMGFLLLLLPVFLLPLQTWKTSPRIRLAYRF